MTAALTAMSRGIDPAALKIGREVVRGQAGFVEGTIIHARSNAVTAMQAIRADRGRGALVPAMVARSAVDDLLAGRPTSMLAADAAEAVQRAGGQLDEVLGHVRSEQFDAARAPLAEALSEIGTAARAQQGMTERIARNIAAGTA